jgi:DNA-binding LacI/PurR family transcriptional regulator
MEHNYQIFLTRTFNRDMIRQGRYDGFLLLVYNSYEVLDDIHFLRDNHLPFVISDFQDMVQSEFATVSVDVKAAGFKAAKHLFDLGHDNIVFATSQIDPKWIGVQMCCEQCGKHASLLFFQNGEDMRNYFDIGSRCATDIVAMKKIPTAVIAANDEIAVGLINKLTRLGYKVPDEISVIGFDDTYIAAYCNPSLTTLHYPKTRIGRDMAQMLIEMLTGELSQKNVILQTEFIRRESTSRHGCAASAE